jgi:hypothetical protein
LSVPRAIFPAGGCVYFARHTEVEPCMSEDRARSAVDTKPTDAQLGAIIGLLTRRADVGIALDASYFTSHVSLFPDALENKGSGQLLPEQYTWKPEGAEAPRVPLQLCEFLAYKTALAYEPEERIKTYLSDCCDGMTNFIFFDSKDAADTQGYGFVFENKAFVVFRGTETAGTGMGLDWAINLSDAMTDTLGNVNDKRRIKLLKQYGDVFLRVAGTSPGRHAGFAVAWEAIRSQVEAWLRGLPPRAGGYPVFFAGHSLGGAVALLGGYDLARREVHTVGGVITFGAPMVGDNAFSRDFDRLLGDRTVRLESTGDIVPAIMRRGYFRHLYFLRQWLKSGLTLEQNNQVFAAVGQEWKFAQEPPLGHHELKNALSQLSAALERAAKEEQARKDAAEKSKRSDDRNPGDKKPVEQKPSDTPAKNTQAPGLTTADGTTVVANKPDGTTAPSKPGGDGNRTVIFVVVGVAVVFAVAAVVWYIYRRKLFSHDVQQRYALYLSTLSYQELRRKHNGDLTSANAELDQHLHFVRGNARKLPKYYDVVSELPVKLSLQTDEIFKTYLERQTTFV